MVEDKSGNRKYGVRRISHFTKKKDDDDDDDDGFAWEIRHWDCWSPSRLGTLV